MLKPRMTGTSPIKVMKPFTAAAKFLGLGLTIFCFTLHLTFCTGM